MRISGLSASPSNGGIDLEGAIGRVQSLFAAAEISLLSTPSSTLTVEGSVQSTGGDILLFADGGNLDLPPDTSVQSPRDVTLATNHNFQNFSSDPGSIQSGGRTLIYTASVAAVQLGAIAVNATEFGKTYPDQPDATTGNILLTINDDVVIPPVVVPPVTTPTTPEMVTGSSRDRPDDTATPPSNLGAPPSRVLAILDGIRRNSPRDPTKPDTDNPANQIGGTPHILVARLDSSSSSDRRPLPPLHHPLLGAPFAGARFAGPDSDLPLVPELGPVTFGTGGTFGTSGTALPKDLLESLGDKAVEELKDALQIP